MPPDSISEYPFLKFSKGGMPQDPSICMLCMQCTLQLHTMLTTLTQHLPDQSKFASYTPDAAIALMTVRLPIDLVEKTPIVQSEALVGPVRESDTDSDFALDLSIF